MTQELPKYFDVRRLVEHNGKISGVLSAHRLARIASPYSTSGDVMVSAWVSADDPRNPRLIGSLETQVSAICQRCLHKMLIRIDRVIDTVLVDSVAVRHDSIDDAHDSLIIVDGKIDIEQFVEDEVMLAFPMIPLHNTGECHASKNADEILSEQRQKPFTGLAGMLAAVDEKDTR